MKWKRLMKTRNLGDSKQGNTRMMRRKHTETNEDKRAMEIWKAPGVNP